MDAYSASSFLHRDYSGDNVEYGVCILKGNHSGKAKKGVFVLKDRSSVRVQEITCV